MNILGDVEHIEIKTLSDTRLFTSIYYKLIAVFPMAGTSECGPIIWSELTPNQLNQQPTARQ